MQLRKIKYYQYINDPRLWDLSEVELENINLLVGKNASGKSKTINVIDGLSQLLSENNKLNFTDGYYHVLLNRNGADYDYELEYEKHHVVKERLKIGGEKYMLRDPDGGGYIYTQGKLHKHEFKIPSDELKVNRRDEIQYPYLDDINFWARHVRVFRPSVQNMGKGFLGVRDKNRKTEIEFNLKETLKVVDTFNRGVKKHGKKFTENVIVDFNRVGFDITDINLGGLTSVGLEIVDNPDVEVVGLRVKEKSLQCLTDQNDMSEGMFRALAIVVHFNFYELEQIPGCILIDDVGEGLDFERSTNLIQLLIEKAERDPVNIQLIMSTNDRFVMNSVDIKYWQVIDRIGSKVNYFNHRNSPEIFEEFKFTGLSNFDFFATGFFKKGFEKGIE